MMHFYNLKSLKRHGKYRLLFSFPLKKKKKQWVYCKSYVVCCVPSVQNVGTLSNWAFHQLSIAKLQNLWAVHLWKHKQNPALMVAYEKRSWRTRVGENLIFHFLPLKKFLKLLETYSMCMNCQHQKMKGKTQVWIDPARYHGLRWS